MVLALMGGWGGKKGGGLGWLCQMGRVVVGLKGLERGCGIEREDLDQWLFRVGWIRVGDLGD